VRNKFFSRSGRYAGKISQVEEGLTVPVKALAYPEFFWKDIDEIILKYFKR
jgi:hypothetical protein